MKWKQMLFTIVLNIFLMLMVSIMMEYSNLSERFVAIEDTVQEALDQAIMASVHSEEFFSEQYQGKLMSYAGVESGSSDTTVEATTLVWCRGAQKFVQLNTYQFAEWSSSNDYSLPSTNADVGIISGIGTSDRYGLVGHVYEWLYGGAGSDYTNASLAYANRNSARIAEYTAEGTKASGTRRNTANTDFKAFYDQVGNMQQTAGYLKECVSGTTSYKLSLVTYPVLQNMGLSWMGGYTSASSTITGDNLCSSLHIGKSRAGSKSTYYFLTPSSLGVTYVPVEVLKPVFKANLDTITRLNKLGGTKVNSNTSTAKDILSSADYCVDTSVYDFNAERGRYTSGRTNTGHVAHTPAAGEMIVSDGLVEFDLNSIQVKVDYFYHDFSDSSAKSALLISKLNGTLTPDGAGGSTTETALRNATLAAFQNQDTSRYVNPFSVAGNYYNAYETIGKGRVIARVTAKVKVHVPYQSGILQWASYMFTGTNHFDIKRFDPTTGSAFTTLAESDGLWYQYTTYFCTSRS